MKTFALAAVVVLAAASAAAAQDYERVMMARVRLTTDPNTAAGCTPLGAVADDSVKDLRRKILRMGGDTAVVSFPILDIERIHAQVYRCPPAPALPSGVPPPPPGPPPPPPPR